MNIKEKDSPFVHWFRGTENCRVPFVKVVAFRSSAEKKETDEKLTEIREINFIGLRLAAFSVKSCAKLFNAVKNVFVHNSFLKQSDLSFIKYLCLAGYLQGRNLYQKSSHDLYDCVYVKRKFDLVFMAGIKKKYIHIIMRNWRQIWH